MSDHDLPQLDRIERKLDTLLFGSPGPIIDRKEAMRITKCHSIGAFHRFKVAHGIVTVSRGRYSRTDIENIIARRIHEQKQKLPD